jgi:hypothetical protein
MRAAAIGGWALVLMACNAIAGLDQDFVLASDGGTTLPSGTSSGEPPFEGGTSGSVPVPEGGPDASAEVHCANPPKNTIFCWDFEDLSKPATVPFGWSTGSSLGGGSLAVDTTGGGPGGRALHAIVVGSGTSHSTVLWENITLPSAWTPSQSLIATFQFRVKQAGTYAVIGAFQFNSQEDGISAYDAVCSGAAPCVDENDPPGRPHDPTGSIPLDTNHWYQGKITLTPTGTGSFSHQITVDGAVVDSRATGAMPGPAIPKIVQLGIGAFYSGNNVATTETYVDDVVVVFQ